MDQDTTQYCPTPALLAALRRAFSAEAVQHLSAVYTWVARHGGLCEDTPRRSAGTSFNPRPARLGLIALRELPGSSEVEIAALLLSALPLHQTAPSEFQTAAELALTVRRRSAESMPSAATALACCIALDDVRHLHLSDAPAAGEIISHAARLAAVLEGDERCARLRTLVLHAMDQQSALLQARGVL
ncbi:MAG: hypothetical protein EBZ48_08160 [Proteobacteria bacterium]|nr:hypothetical protein [Pseudomonadota bacterium]